MEKSHSHYQHLNAEPMNTSLGKSQDMHCILLTGGYCSSQYKVLEDLIYLNYKRCSIILALIKERCSLKCNFFPDLLAKLCCCVSISIL